MGKITLQVVCIVPRDSDDDLSLEITAIKWRPNVTLLCINLLETIKFLYSKGLFYLQPRALLFFQESFNFPQTVGPLLVLIPNA